MRPSATSAIPYLRLYGDREIQVLETSSGNYFAALTLEADDTSVNGVNIAAAGTGNSALIEARGGDTDIDIEITPKGTGVTDITSALGIGGELELLGANKFIGAEAPNATVYQVMSFNVVDNAVNSVQVNAAATGNMPGLQATGTDPDMNLQLTAKGTGMVQSTSEFQLDLDKIKGSLGDTVVEFIPQTSAVNHIQIGNNTAGNSPTIVATGTDADVGITLTPKGIGGVTVSSELFAASNLVFQTAGSEIWVESPTTGGKAAIKLTAEDNAVNSVQITGSATGNPGVIAAVGTDTNIDLDLQGKGTGKIYAISDVVLDTGIIRDTNDNELLTSTATGSAVNHFQIINAATGNAPDFQAVGDDADIDLKLTPKGTGLVDVIGTLNASELTINDNALVQADYAGITMDDNSTETTIPLVNSLVKITTFDTNLPEAMSSGDHTRDELTIGSTGDYELMFTSSGFSAANNKIYEYFAFQLEPAVTITNVTSANPVVVTASGHGLSNGDMVAIKDVVGTTEVNNRIFEVAGVAGDNFSLKDDSGTDIDGSGFTAYSSAGKTQKALETTLHVHRKYAVGTDVGSVASSTIASLTAGNFIQMYVENVTDTTALTVESANLTMKRVG